MKKRWIFLPAAILVVIILSFFLFFKGIFIKEPDELLFRITWDELSSRGRAISWIVEDYNQSQKHAHVTMVGGNESRQEYVLALEADEIDVYMVPYRYIRDSKIADEFLLLTDLYLEQEEYYYETIKALAKSENGISAIPWIGHSMGLIYNKELTDIAGVFPEDFESVQDLLDACEAICQKTGHKGLGLVGAECHDLTWMVSQFIYSFGGKLANVNMRGRQTEAVIDSDESMEAVAFYIEGLGRYAQDGWQEHTGTEVMEAFAAGEIAFEIQGPWGITDVWKRRNGFEVGAISLSHMGMYSEVGPLMLAVSKDTRNVEKAKDFIRYLTDKDTLEKIMEGEYDEKYEAYYPFRVPLRNDMEDSEFFEKYPDFLVFIEGYEKPSINTPTSEWEEEYDGLYSYYVHQAILGNISVEEALKAIAQKKQK